MISRIWTGICLLTVCIVVSPPKKGDDIEERGSSSVVGPAVSAPVITGDGFNALGSVWGKIVGFFDMLVISRFISCNRKYCDIRRMR